MPMLNAQGYLYKDISAELAVGVLLESQLYLVVPLYSRIPLFISYANIGKYDKHFPYNRSGLTHFTLYAGPGHRYFTDEMDSLDIASASSAGFSMQHGFALGSSFSLVLQNAQHFDFFSHSFEDDADVLVGTSDLYFTSTTGATLNIPLSKKINSGLFWYRDALFADVGYSLHMRGNRRFFESEAFETLLFTKEDFDRRRLRTSHVLSAGLSMGIYKDVFYFRKLSLQYNYELLRKLSHVTLTLGG